MNLWCVSRALAEIGTVTNFYLPEDNGLEEDETLDLTADSLLETFKGFAAFFALGAD
jgi:hypothetical protein